MGGASLQSDHDVEAVNQSALSHLCLRGGCDLSFRWALSFCSCFCRSVSRVAQCKVKLCLTSSGDWSGWRKQAPASTEQDTSLKTPEPWGPRWQGSHREPGTCLPAGPPSPPAKVPHLHSIRAHKLAPPH